MDFSSIGSISNYAKTLKLQTQWKIKKQSGDVTSHSKSLNDLLGVSSSSNTEKEHTNDNKLSEIMQKVYSGKKLSGEELEYLQAKSPELYQKVRDMEQEQKSYENELKNCKTKEDVQRVKMSHIGKSLATVKSVEHNPNITMAKKLETAQLENAKVRGIEARTAAFVRSISYKALPTEAEQAEERQERIQEVKDRFTSGDNGGTIQELTQEPKTPVKSPLDSYCDKVTPAYRERGLEDNGHDTSLPSKLTNDTELFSNQIAGILSLLDKANGIVMDYYA